MFGDLDWPQKASRDLSAIAEFAIYISDSYCDCDDDLQLQFWFVNRYVI